MIRGPVNVGTPRRFCLGTTSSLIASAAMGGEAVAFFGDISDFEIAGQLIQSTVEQFGSVGGSALSPIKEWLYPVAIGFLRAGVPK